ncbi:MAG: hypothetical protein V1779_08915 [bacterium]
MGGYVAKISSKVAPILWAKAKREDKKLDELVNELLSIALWNEPEVLFKGQNYRVEPDLFGKITKPPDDN